MKDGFGNDEMHHRSFPDWQVKVRFYSEGWQRLHQVTDQQVKSEVINDNPIKDGNWILIWK